MVHMKRYNNLAIGCGSVVYIGRNFRGKAQTLMQTRNPSITRPIYHTDLLYEFRKMKPKRHYL